MKTYKLIILTICGITLVFCAGIFTGVQSVKKYEYNINLINQDSVEINTPDTVYKVHSDSIRVTLDKDNL